MSEQLIELRRILHRTAERSGEEHETAAIIRAELERTRPDLLVTGLGGAGVAAAYGDGSGETLLLRADLDALPLPDDPALPWASAGGSAAHRCGHDGHMAILVGAARRIASRRPIGGRVVLLFQPAEETGNGALRVIEDPAFAPLEPDVAIAQHNLPGFPLGDVIVRPGAFASSSRGMIVHYRGETSHAAEPHRGSNAALVSSVLARSLTGLAQTTTALHEAAQVTVVGIDVGGPAFGTCPGSGRVMATLRAYDGEVTERLAARAADLARDLGCAHRLSCEVSWTDDFPATINDPDTVDLVVEAARSTGARVVTPEHPFSWSEDFGHFSRCCPSVLFCLGSGAEQPGLHAEGYDFPDELIEPGAALLEAIVRRRFAAEEGP